MDGVLSSDGESRFTLHISRSVMSRSGLRPPPIRPIATRRPPGMPLALEVQPRDERDGKGGGHLALADASGDSAIFEYISGKLVIHHDRKYTVMTNSPT